MGSGLGLGLGLGFAAAGSRQDGLMLRTSVPARTDQRAAPSEGSKRETGATRATSTACVPLRAGRLVSAVSRTGAPS